MTRPVRHVRIDRIVVRGLDPGPHDARQLRRSLGDEIRSHLASADPAATQRPARVAANGTPTARTTKKIAAAIRAHVEEP